MILYNPFYWYSHARIRPPKQLLQSVTNESQTILGTWDWKKQAWRDWWRNEREAWSCCRLWLRRPYLERVWPMTMWGQDRLLKWVSWVEYCTLYYTATHLALPEWIFDWGLIQLKVQIIRTSTTISIIRIRLNFYLFFVFTDYKWSKATHWLHWSFHK